MVNNNSIECLLCNSGTQLKQKSLPGYQLGTTFSIHYCSTCETSFPLPRVDTANIYEYIYKNGEQVSGYARYWSYFNNVKSEKHPLDYLANSEEAYWGIQEALKKIIEDRAHVKILEIGSGLGYLTYALKENGYNVIGIDISKEAVTRAKTQFGNFYKACDLFDYVKDNPEHYDVVILTEVIEHVDDPLIFIEAAVNLLKSSGYIVMTTPNKTIMPLDIVWETESPPVHQWWFSENSMNYMAKKFNLKVSFINFSKFYKVNPKILRLKKIRKNRFREAILNTKGEVIKIASFSEKSKMEVFYYNLKINFRKILANFNPNIIVCDKRGDAMCAIFEKGIHKN